MKILSLIFVFFVGTLSLLHADPITIVGSGTVYPFTKLLSEKFRETHEVDIDLQKTGTVLGFREFCKDTNPTSQINNASRKITPEEIKECIKNGIGNPLELKIGYDGIVIAQPKNANIIPSLSFKQIFLALAKELPDEQGVLVSNPHKTWKSIDSKLPDSRISVMGPSETSGTRDTLIELVMEKGALEIPALKKIHDTDPTKFKSICSNIRTDGFYVDAGENYEKTAEKLKNQHESIAIFGFGYYEKNKADLHAIKVDEIGPDFETISTGKYPLSRMLYLYVNRGQLKLNNDLKEFIKFYIASIKKDGALKDTGLIYLHEEEWKKLEAEWNSQAS